MNEEQLHEKIQNRYKEESKQTCSLSCGSTLDKLEIREGESILDLGCGRGTDTIQAAKLAGSNGIAAGLDLTEEMVAQAMNYAEEIKINNAVFIQGDIEALPFK